MERTQLIFSDGFMARSLQLMICAMEFWSCYTQFPNRRSQHWLRKTSFAQSACWKSMRTFPTVKDAYCNNSWAHPPMYLTDLPNRLNAKK